MLLCDSGKNTAAGEKIEQNTEVRRGEGVRRGSIWDGGGGAGWNAQNATVNFVRCRAIYRPPSKYESAELAQTVYSCIFASFF